MSRLAEQSRGVSRCEQQSRGGSAVLSSPLLGLPDSEDEGTTFLRNVGKYLRV